MVRGSCLCGDVTFEAAGPLEVMSHCHCSMCRKHHGAAFGSYAAAPAAGFRVARGEPLVAFFESSPGNRRSFCGRCGSTLWNASTGDHVFLPAGCFDDDPDARPLAHIFVGSLPPWDAISDSLPRIDTIPPGMGVALERPAPPPAPPGRARGSCLCGAIAYEVTGPPLALRHCHCSRCRKARSAAHATNAFWRAGALRWLRGGDLVRSFKVPDARYFTNTFCGVCGSKVPRVDPERDFAVAPAGGLDDDPGLRPQMHIFVGSKAPWYEIADALPRHEGAAPTPPGA